MNKKQLILGVIEDAVSKLLYYDRKEDEDLPVGEIDIMVGTGEIIVDEMVKCFCENLMKGLSNEG